MGTATDNRSVTAKISDKPPTCGICFKTYTPECDWRQGRCPHHPALIDASTLPNLKHRLKKILGRMIGKNNG